jgi:hypothetical protein
MAKTKKETNMNPLKPATVPITSELTPAPLVSRDPKTGLIDALSYRRFIVALLEHLGGVAHTSYVEQQIERYFQSKFGAADLEWLQSKRRRRWQNIVDFAKATSRIHQDFLFRDGVFILNRKPLAKLLQWASAKDAPESYGKVCPECKNYVKLGEPMCPICKFVFPKKQARRHINVIPRRPQ